MAMQLVLPQMSTQVERAGVGRGEAAGDPASEETMWPVIREHLLAGTYRPSPVRRVKIPKPDGGERELGIPTVTDRLIQQALLQVLQPILDPTFSEHSYGFRPGRRAHDAVLAAQSYVPGWKTYFQLAQTPGVWRDLDQWIRHRLRAIKLRQCKLGKTMYRKLTAMVAQQREVPQWCSDDCVRAHDAVLAAQSYVPGWKTYFQLAQTPGVWRDLDQWIRHRLRAIKLRQCKLGKTMYRKLTAMVAQQREVPQWCSDDCVL